MVLYMNDAYLPKEAIGYLRVSTEMQASDGRSLDIQAQKVRTWAASHNMDVHWIYEDVASAMQEDLINRRPDFVRAVRHALRDGLPLIVSDVSRVSRNLDVLEKLVISEGLKIISVYDDGEVPVGILRQRVEKAEKTAHKISEGTRDAVASGARTRQPANAEARGRAAASSARVRIMKKFVVLDRVVTFLEDNPGLLEKTSQEIADRLNEAGILTGWSKPWTASAVRGKMGAIRDEFALRDGDRDEAHMEELEQMLRQASSDEESGKSITERPDVDAELKNNPLFGMF